MTIYEDLLAGKTKLSLVGLGYVGMPIAVAFAKKIGVVGYDLNAKKIELYKNGIDPTNEVGNDAINVVAEITLGRNRGGWSKAIGVAGCSGVMAGSTARPESKSAVLHSCKATGCT